MPRPLVLAAGSVLDASAEHVVECAAAGGFDGIGLRISGEHATDLRSIRERCAALGVMIHDVEVHRIATAATDPEPLLLAAAELGAPRLLVVSDLPEAGRTTDEVGRLVQRAHALGVGIGLEYMAWTTPSAPQVAIAIAEATGCRLVVDALHHHRVGATAADLRTLVASGHLGWLQLCDAPFEHPAHGDLLREARHERLPPGDGALPLGELLAVVPDDVAVSVEVQSDVLRGIDPMQRSAVLADSARRVLRATSAHQLGRSPSSTE